MVLKIECRKKVKYILSSKLKFHNDSKFCGKANMLVTMHLDQSLGALNRLPVRQPAHLLEVGIQIAGCCK